MVVITNHGEVLVEIDDLVVVVKVAIGDDLVMVLPDKVIMALLNEAVELEVHQLVIMVV